MNTPSAPHDFQNDIDVISRSPIIPTLLEAIVLATGMGFVAVARVTESRWVTCRAVDTISFGLKAGDELEVESTLCHEVRQYDEEIVIDDVNLDPVYVNHHCPARYGFRGYISVPIRRADGSFFGTLCAIDPQPHKLKTDRVLGMFRLFAKTIGEVLDTDEVLTESQGALSHERDLAEVQEQFIAVLAHDLRNPVSALSAGLRMIGNGKVDDKTLELVSLMRGSVNRMQLLIENLLDQARKRSGGGIIIERAPTKDLGAALSQVAGELQAVTPDQTINMKIDLPAPVNCDLPRISQLFSNLLGNAVSHGTSGEPIEVDARLIDGYFVLTVTNSGDPIPDDLVPNLFLPFEGSGKNHSREGLGLGLFIAMEIAKGHGATLTVASDALKIAFTLRMPNSQDKLSPTEREQHTL